MQVSHSDSELNSSRLSSLSPGHVQITYFCSWSDVEESCDKEAIANMYCAPGEIYIEFCFFFSFLLFRLLSLIKNLILDAMDCQLDVLVGLILCRHAEP